MTENIKEIQNQLQAAQKEKNIDQLIALHNELLLNHTLDPLLPSILFNMGLFHLFESQRIDLARDSFLVCTKLKHPDFLEKARNFYAQCLIAEKKYEVALFELKKNISKNPTSLETIATLRLMALVYEETQNLPEYKKVFREQESKIIQLLQTNPPIETVNLLQYELALNFLSTLRLFEAKQLLLRLQQYYQQSHSDLPIQKSLQKLLDKISSKP